ncbi:energy-coupling factor transporter transmembrane component T family protein [Leisingera daeponensis]|uniref:energy-coupling factor transporter transmembrane component T family protein n=1 Tax=Leisingera daeponensis TaxID=405746 RepID=UPI001C98D7D7|nr:energy-coupling factor transporter transmembrane component T [Leisingera daeponensis]MBY6059293.1 energy-coupling factor transporter transmembrane protein EcfT [Leisingera daeponensis]
MISLTSPVRTRAHSWPAGVKLAALGAATFALFLISDLRILAAALVGMAGLYALPGRQFFRTGMERLRVLWPFLAILAIWHILTATYAEGAEIILRLLTAVGLANLVTMTTALSEMIAVIRLLATPLRRLGLSTRALELAIALVIRILPALIENGQRLSDAWRARSPRRPGWRVVVPFTLLALDDADHLAEALRARGGILENKET